MNHNILYRQPYFTKIKTNNEQDFNKIKTNDQELYARWTDQNEYRPS